MSELTRHQARRKVEETAIDLAVLVSRLEHRMSEFVAQLRGMTVNDILDTELAVLDAGGIFTRDWEVPFAAVSVVNFGGTLVLASDPPQSVAPSGPGSAQIGAGAAALVNITGRVLTLYGTPGALVSLSVYTRPQPPAFGPASAASSSSAVFADSTTPLAINATVNGAPRLTAGYSHFRAFASSNQAGTLSIQQSRDGATWYTTTTQPIAGDATIGTVLESILAMRYVRVTYTNGAAAQTSFELDSALIVG